MIYPNCSICFFTGQGQPSRRVPAVPFRRAGILLSKPPCRAHSLRSGISNYRRSKAKKEDTLKAVSSFLADVDRKMRPRDEFAERARDEFLKTKTRRKRYDACDELSSIYGKDTPIPYPPFTKIANQRKRMTGTPHGGAAHLRRTSVLRAKPWRRAHSLRSGISNYRGVKRPQGAEPKKEDMTFVMSSFLELMM